MYVIMDEYSQTPAELAADAAAHHENVIATLELYMRLLREKEQECEKLKKENERLEQDIEIYSAAAIYGVYD